MKNRLLFLLVVFCSLGLLVNPGCKTAEEAAQYVLTVTVGEGITGTPATGSYSYTDADLVNFSYSLQTGYENLVIQLDGVTVGNTGIIAMNTNHTLNVTADEIFDVTFSGGLYSGTTTGTMQNVTGTGYGNYSITGDQITFDLIWGGLGDMHFWGTINSDNSMSGNWESYSGGNTGNWTLDR